MIKKKNVSLKFYLVSVILCALLFSSIIIVQSAYIGSVSEIWLTPPMQEATYIIGRYNSSHYYAKNYTGFGTSGNEGYELLSSNASDIINTVIAGLPARNWYETILIRDNITVDTTIQVYSYTRIEVEGIITCAGSMNSAIFQNENTASGNDHIIVKGGVLDGNKAAQSGGTFGLIYWVKVSDSLISEMSICNSYVYGIWFNNANGNTVTFTNVTEARYQGIKVSASDNIISSCRVQDCGSAAVGISGIELGGTGNSIFNCWFYQGDTTTPFKMYYGISVKNTGNSIIGCVAENMFHCGYLVAHNKTAITGCVAYDCGETGVTAYYVVHTIAWLSISGCTFINNGDIGTHLTAGGIRLYLTIYATVTGCVLDTNDYYGIHLDMSNNSVINSNVVYGSPEGINITNSDNNAVFANELEGNTVACAFKTSTNLQIRDNLGFRTENTGSAYNTTATTFVFNHNLNGTPTLMLASFNQTGYATWTWTATSTQITVTMASALPSNTTMYWKARYVP